MNEIDKMQQTQTQLVNKPQQKNDLKYFQSITRQLNLQCSPTNQEDYEQLRFILTTILPYPSTQLAELHRNANRLGNRDILMGQERKKIVAQEMINTQYCNCCGFVKQEQQIKICQNTNDIGNFGLSTFLYFQNLKNLTVIIFQMIIIYSIYAFTTNLIASGKFKQCGYTNYSKCTSNIDYISISLGSKQLNKTEQNKMFYYIQAWIGVGMVLIWLLTFLGLKYSQRKLKIQVDDQTISASDFSIVIENIPQDFTQQQLQNQLNEYQKNIINIPKALRRPLLIRKFNKGKSFYMDQSQFKDQNLTKLQKQHQQMIQSFIDWILERQQNRSFSTSKEQRQKLYKQYQQNLIAQQKIIQQFQNKIKKKMEQQTDNNTVIFVTLDTNYAKNMITTLNPIDLSSKFRNFITCNNGVNKLTLKHNNQTLEIKVQRAPQPQDIIWNNLGISDSQKLKRKILTYTVTIIMLGVSFAAVYGLSRAQVENSQNRYLSLLISLLISFINVIISKMIRILSIYERDYTTIKYQTSLALKSILAQLINQIVIPIIANYFIKNNLYAKNGLADDIFLLGITSSLLPPILKYFDGGYYYSKILMFLKSRPTSKLYLNQEQLNRIYIGLQFETGYEYIYSVNLFIFVCFFVSLQPIISVFALVGLLMMYWVQKWVLFNRMRRPIPGNDLINQAMSQLIFLGPVVYSLGSLTWSNFFPGGIPASALLPNLIALGISVITLIFPISLIFSCFIESQAQELVTYDDNRIFLSTQYQRLNPSTAQQGFKDYMKYFQQMKQKFSKASKQQQQKAQKKMNTNAQKGHQAMANQGMSMNMGPIGGLLLPRPAPMMMPMRYSQQGLPMLPGMNPMMLAPRPPIIMNPMQLGIIPSQQINQSINVQPQNNNYGYQNGQNQPINPAQNLITNQFPIQNNMQNPQIRMYPNQPMYGQAGGMYPNNMAYGFGQRQSQQQPGYIFQQPFQQPYNPFGFR